MRVSRAAIVLTACLAATCGEGREPTTRSVETTPSADTPRRGPARAARSKADIASTEATVDPADKWIDALVDINSTDDERLDAAREVGKLGSRVLPRVVAMLDEPRTAGWALLALARMGEAATPLLPRIAGLLEDPTVVLRDAARDALANIGEAAVPFLCRAMKSATADVRQRAAQALGSTGTSRADVAAMLAAAATKDPACEVRAKAVEALAKLSPGSDVTLPTLVAALRDDNESVRSSAAEALKGIGESAAPALDAIVASLVDEAGVVRPEAIDALEAVGPAAADAAPRLVELARRRPELSGRVVQALEQIFPSRVSALLSDECPELRRAAVASVGWKNDDSAPAAIATLLEDPVAEVRQDAIEELTRIGIPPEAVAKLRANLTHSSVDVRLAAADAMGRIPTPSADAARDLVVALHDADARVRAAAAWSLGELATAPSVSLPALVAALADPDAEVEAAVVTAIGSFGKDARDAVPDLRRRLGAADTSIALAAAKSLVRIEPSSGEAVACAIGRLRDSDGRVRTKAVEILGLARDLASLPAVIERLDDRMPGVCIAAAKAVAAFGTDAAAATAMLEKAARSGELGVRAAAREALEKVRPPAREVRAADASPEAQERLRALK